MVLVKLLSVGQVLYLPPRAEPLKALDAATWAALGGTPAEVAVSVAGAVLSGFLNVVGSLDPGSTTLGVGSPVARRCVL